MPDALCEWLSDMQEFSDCTFCVQFPDQSKITPLETPVVVLGSKSLNVLYNAADDVGNVIKPTRVAELNFSIGIHVPRSFGGGKCFVILDKITEMLLFNSGLRIKEMLCGEIKYIRNTDSLYLPATFAMDEIIKTNTRYPPLAI